MRRLALATVLLAATVGLPNRAAALFHASVIDEVVTSYGGDSNAQFVEIRMLAVSQTFTTNAVLAAFDASGAYVGDVLVVPADVANGGAGVRWIAGTAAFQAASGLAADFTFTPGVLPTGGGMVCFGGGGGILPAAPGSWSRTSFANYVDCVAYGSYAGPSNPLIGTPTPIAPDGHSVVRIGTTANNAADFTCGDPATPENNAGGTVALPATTPCPAAPVTNVGIAATKLIAVDKLASAGKAKVVFVAKDPSVTKGAGTDPADIAVTFVARYANDSAIGGFVLPAGDPGWLVNKATVAKFVNKSAPAGSTQAKVGVIKPAKLVKVVGKGLGDTPFDVLAAGDPLGPVHTAYCVTNAGAETCHCSTFGACAFKSIAAGTGAKLVCKVGAADAGCAALAP